MAAFSAGIARMIRNELMNTIQTNSGTRRSVMPGARNDRMVTIMLTEPATEPTPSTSSARIQ